MTKHIGRDKMPDISVIVPIYKVEKYLENCIRSLLSQTYSNFELILVNDGSPDNCGRICDEFKEKDSRVRVIHQVNQGTGAARNNGLSIAKGKYIYFCDPDDYVKPNLLEDNFNLATKYNANLVVFGYYNVEFNGKNHDNQKLKVLTSDFEFLESQFHFRDKFEGLYKKNIMYTLWNKLYKKEYLDNFNCRFSFEKVGQDTVFNYRVYKDISRVVINNKLYYHYYINRIGSATNSYREDRFTIRYSETQKFEEMLKSWGNVHKYKKVLYNDWITTLIIGISNLFYEGCPLNRRNKELEARRMVNSLKINKVLLEIPLKDVNSLYRKVTIAFLKLNLYNCAFLILRLKNTVKKYV